MLSAFLVGKAALETASLEQRRYATSPNEFNHDTSTLVPRVTLGRICEAVELMALNR